MPDSTSEGLWQCLARHEDGSAAWLAVIWSTDHTDGHRIEAPESEARSLLSHDGRMSCAHYSHDGEVSSLIVTSLAAPRAPSLWFAELAEPTGKPPATSLVAFTGFGIESGTLVDRASLGDIAVASSDQLGAVRWYPESGEIDQVYVSPTSRRQSIGSALLAAAGTLNVARDLPRVWADGQRTADGDRLRRSHPFGHRAADLTHLAPPMTPFDQR